MSSVTSHYFQDSLFVSGASAWIFKAHLSRNSLSFLNLVVCFFPSLGSFWVQNSELPQAGDVPSE